MLESFILLLALSVLYVWLCAGSTQKPSTHRKKRSATSARTAHKRSAGQQREEAQHIRTIDGDTIEVLLNGKIEKVRYIGVDCPEHNQPGFLAATQYNDKLVSGKRLILQSDKQDSDKYGRKLRYVETQDGTFVNRELIKHKRAKIAVFEPNVARIAEMVG